MPILNDNKCYAEQPERTVIEVPPNLRADWLTDFYDRLAEKLKTEKEPKKPFIKESFINEFNRHAGVQSTYTLKSQLLESLRKLYCIYTHPETNPDQQSRIASGICEDIDKCSPGFSNRVNFLLTLFDIPKDLDELLAKARFNLVDNIARDFAQNSQEGVHVHSRFFVIAETFGYGVSAINKEDIYLNTGSDDKSDDYIEKILADGFENRFRLFGIVDLLREQIENLMTTQGYKNGRNEEGYEAGIYEKFIDLVKHFINIDDCTELFEMDVTETKVIDINWQRINLELFNKLIEENYVKLSPEEATLLGQLAELQDPTAQLPELQDPTALNTLIPNGYELAQCLSFFSKWTIEQKATLVMAYLKDKTPKDQEAVLAILDDQVPQLTAQLKSQPAFHYFIAILKGDIASVKTHIEKGADINAAIGLLFSGDHKSNTLYWLHDNKALIATLTSDGMKAIIPNGKYKNKTIAEALTSTKKGRQLLLENPDLQKLVPGSDWLQQAQEDKKKVINVLEGFFKKPDPLAIQLGQYIAYGDMTKAEELLKANSTRLEKLLTEKVSGIKDYSRLKHKGTAFQLALSAMDDEMCEMLAKYMKEDQIAYQYQEIFPEGHEKYYAEQKSFDFTDMVEIITNSNHADLQKALDLELPNNTALWQKLEKFRTDFTDCSKQETVWNPQYLIKAFELYDQKFDSWNWRQLNLFWRQVIGYVQRFMPANLAMDFAQGLYDRVEEKKQSKRSFKFRYGNDSIYPLAFDDSLAGLGFEYAAWERPEGGWAGRPSALPRFIQNLCQTKIFTLSKLMQRYQQKNACVIF